MFVWRNNGIVSLSDSPKIEIYIPTSSYYIQWDDMTFIAVNNSCLKMLYIGIIQCTKVIFGGEIRRQDYEENLIEGAVAAPGGLINSIYFFIHAKHKHTENRLSSQFVTFHLRNYFQIYWYRHLRRNPDIQYLLLIDSLLIKLILNTTLFLGSIFFR